MSDIKTCGDCGVPLRIGRDHRWNPDGTITQKRDPDHRMILFDSRGLDALFSNIEQLIGVPIEKIVIESKARATKAYIKKMIRGPKGPLAKLIGIEKIIRKIVEQGRVMGYGDIHVREYSWKESYMKCEIGNPYSLPMFCGDLKGADEAIRKVAGTISYKEIGKDRYLIENYSAPHAPELEERLLPKPTPRKRGNIEYDYCPGCHVPREISQFNWDFEKGTITLEEFGLRLALFGPYGFQAIIDELEEELGESIPETIVEAQRIHANNSLRFQPEMITPEFLARSLGIGGLGNLANLEQVGDSVNVRIENAAVPLILVGTALSFYESVMDARGSVAWEIAADGDLAMELTPAG